jgi:hypothetical protein
MNSIKKYKTFNLSLLQSNQIDSLGQVIDKACEQLKELDFHRYVTARKCSNNTASSKLDFYLAIDDIIYNDELNLCIGVDWTTNSNSLLEKVAKHKNLSQILNLVVDKTCVVLVQNEDLLDIDSASLAKAVYNLLKLINKEVSKKNYAGYLIVDAKDLI